MTDHTHHWHIIESRKLHDSNHPPPSESNTATAATPHARPNTHSTRPDPDLVATRRFNKYPRVQRHQTVHRSVAFSHVEG